MTQQAKGVCRIASINVEAMGTQLHEIQALHDDAGEFPDILVISEHRVPTSRQASMQERLKELDFEATFSVTPQTAGRPHGGVAVLCRNGFQFVPSNELDNWTAQGRVLVGKVLSPSSRLVTWLGAVYSHTDPQNQRESWQALWNDLELWLRDKHQLPVTLAGDLNSSLRSNPCVGRWVTAGFMNDMVEAHRGERIATHRAGNVLDHILMTERLASHCVDARTQPCYAFPSHRAVFATLRLCVPAEQVVRVVKEFPVDRLKARALLASWARDQPNQHYQQLLQRGHVDEALQDWSARWEAQLVKACAHLGHDLTEAHHGRARSLEEQVQHAPAVPLRRQGWPLPIRQLQTSYNQARPLGVFFKMSCAMRQQEGGRRICSTKTAGKD